MIAAAIVCAAALSHAASCSWAAGEIYFDGKGTTVNAGENMPDDYTVNGYLFTGLSAADYAILSAGEDASKIWGMFDAATGKLSVTGGSTYTGEMAQNEFGDIGWSDTEGTQGVREYAAVILTYTDANGDLYYSANTVTGEPGQKGLLIDTAAAGWGESAGGTATTWQAAPEPTSGLLLLLGVAGLALRRRRA